MGNANTKMKVRLFIGTGTIYYVLIYLFYVLAYSCILFVLLIRCIKWINCDFLILGVWSPFAWARPPYHGRLRAVAGGGPR